MGAGAPRPRPYILYIHTPAHIPTRNVSKGLRATFLHHPRTVFADRPAPFLGDIVGSFPALAEPENRLAIGPLPELGAANAVEAK